MPSVQTVTEEVGTMDRKADVRPSDSSAELTPTVSFPEEAGSAVEEIVVPRLEGTGPMTFTVQGTPPNTTARWFLDGLRAVLVEKGHQPCDPKDVIPRLVLNLFDPGSPRSFRRKAKATFVVSIFPLDSTPDRVLADGYPLLVRSMSNMVIVLLQVGGKLEAHFVTMEQGHSWLRYEGDDGSFFARVYDKLEPLASSNLVIDNVFVPDLPPDLWDGDEVTRQITEAGRRLAALNLLPAPFPIEKVLNDREMGHLRRLFGIGGLSYGNVSARARHDPTAFWMSASGVDKSRLEVVGREILLVKGFDPAKAAMILSVPANVQPRRVSVDAIEHYIIYREHPQVGAILHVHAWMEGVPSTQVDYPCGTWELASAVAELVRRSPDPARAVIGLKNHGLTITGKSLPEIFERIEGKIIRQVPMS
jgi:hypothetical protein